MADEEVEDGGEGEHREEEQDIHCPRRERGIGAKQVAYAPLADEISEQSASLKSSLLQQSCPY